MERWRTILLNYLPWVGSLLSAALACLVWQASLLEKWDYGILHQYQKTSFPTKAAPVQLVTIQRTESQTWPWSSLDYAILLNALGPFSPSVIAMDLPLNEGDPLYPIYDIQLANQMSRFTNIIISQSTTKLAPAPLRASATFAPIAQPSSNSKPLKKFPLALWIDQTWQPTFALQIVASHLNVDWKNSRILSGEAIILKDKKNQLQLYIPIDSSCSTLIDSNFFSTRTEAVDFYSAIISAEDLRNGGTGSDRFYEIRGKIILVGIEAKGAYVPVQGMKELLPPVHLQDQMIRQLLAKKFTTELPPIFYILLILSASLTSATFTLLPSRLLSVSLLLIYMAGCCLGSFFSFELGRYWWPLLPLLTGVLLSWLSASALLLLSNIEKEKQPELFEDF